MVAIIDCNTDKRLSVAEYVDLIESTVDVEDHDSVLESAWALRALANDRDFILDSYHEELKRHWKRDSENIFSPQSVRLGSGTNFFIRSNIWLPLLNENEHSMFERQLYSYDLAHDHNFDFVTVGYFGSGYETDLYEYDYDAVNGYVGEQVDLRPGGRHQLHPGRVMVYRGGRDVHVQRVPAEVSISLNLMCTTRRLKSSQQYLFDVRDSRIVNGAGDLTSMRMFLIDLLRHLNDENTVDLLSEFAVHHKPPRSRALAYKVLRDLAPLEAERLANVIPREVAELSELPLVLGSGSRDYSYA